MFDTLKQGNDLTRLGIRPVFTLERLYDMKKVSERILAAPSYYVPHPARTQAQLLAPSGAEAEAGRKWGQVSAFIPCPI